MLVRFDSLKIELFNFKWFLFKIYLLKNSIYIYIEVIFKLIRRYIIFDKIYFKMGNNNVIMIRNVKVF